MTRALTLISVLILLAAPALAQDCQVVATSPAQGAVVSASTAWVEVTFSLPVRGDGYSFVKNPDMGAFPTVTGKAVFPSPTVCRLPVKLKPGLTYAIGINTAGFSNFRLAQAPHPPCKGYWLKFSTAKP